MAKTDEGTLITHSFAKYRTKRPKLEQTFNRGLRLLDEHIKRHERQMFEGASEENPPEWNPRLAKAGEDLVKSLNSLGQMYLKIQQVNEKMAESMSVEEQIAAFMDWVDSLGRNQWYQLLRLFRVVEAKKEDRYRADKKYKPSK